MSVNLIPQGNPQSEIKYFQIHKKHCSWNYTTAGFEPSLDQHFIYCVVKQHSQNSFDWYVVHHWYEESEYHACEIYSGIPNGWVILISMRKGRQWLSTLISLSFISVISGIDCTVPCTLNTKDNKVQLTRAFADVCQLHQLRHPGDVVGDVVRDGDDEALPLLGLSAFTFLLMMLSHTGGKLYLPSSLLSIGLRALRYTRYALTYALSLVPQCFPTLQNVGGDQRGCVLKPLR